MNQDEFLERLRSSGLMGEERVAEVERRCGSGMTLTDLTDGLLGQGWLTQYQLKKLSRGETTRLSVGQYRILDELGQGGFGCVYKAVHCMMNRLVALKVIAPALVEDKQARSWFLREVLATTHLNHPNIVLAYDANEVDDILFLAMEYVEGPNLEHYVRKNGPLPIGMAYVMLQQLGAALDYAHQQKMVHRDIKPANLLIPRRSTQDFGKPASGLVARASGITNTTLVKLVDFGLARLYGNSRSNTIHLENEKGFVGTPGFVAPEQARSIHEADIRSDLYSLGCTMYFALTGKAPFRGQTPLQVLMQNLEREAEPLRKLRPEVPLALLVIIRRMMAKKAENRFRTPAEMLEELNAAYGFGLQTTAIASPPVEESRPLGAIAAESAATVCLTPYEASNSQEPMGSAPTALVTPVADAKSNPSLATDVDLELSASDKTVRKYWQQWLAVVMATVEKSEHGIIESNYGSLHSELLKVIRFRIQQDANSANKSAATWQTLETLVAPWVSLRSLSAVDLETARGLYSRCESLGRQVGWGQCLKRGWRWPSWAAVLIIVVGLGLLGVAYSTKGLASLGPSANQALRVVVTYPYVVLVPVMGAAGALLLPRFMRG